MKSRNSTLILFTMLLLGTAAFLGGCATTGMDRHVKTVNSIQVVDSEIRKIIVQIDATSASLDSLVKAGKFDLKNAFETYSDNIVKLDNEGQLVLKRVEEMKSRSKEYFSEWEQQGNSYTNPQIRELSEERRIKLAETYAQVPEAGAGIKEAYLSYLADLKEIQRYLANDLTPERVESIAPVAKKAVLEFVALKASLKPVILALDDIKAELNGGMK